MNKIETIKEGFVKINGKHVYHTNGVIKIKSHLTVTELKEVQQHIKHL